MLRYAQDGKSRKVAELLSLGADPNYKQGLLLQVALYMGKLKVAELALAAGCSKGLDEALKIADELGYSSIAQKIADRIVRLGQR
jgi:hypothetical protein